MPPETDFLGVFGCVEFENAASSIVAYLNTPEMKSGFSDWQFDRAPPDSGWEKPFGIESIPSVSGWLFAALCSSGWVEHIWFPKGAFRVTRAFVEKVNAARD